MTIKDIYEKLGTPPNLQEHMLRVTSVSMYIAEHWQGSTLERNILKTMLLLHDIGNIVKFDLEKYPEFLGEKEAKRVDYWVKRQSEAIDKYGKDDHDATVAMLEELHIPQDIQERIFAMGYWDVENVVKSEDWYLKVALYSDLRVGPFGILTLQERLDDIHSRLAKYKERPELIDFAKELEKQVQENMDVSVNTITDETAPINDNLLSHEIAMA